MTGAQVLSHSRYDGSNRIVTAELERSVHGHHNRLHLRAVLATIAKGILPNDHRRANFSFGVIVIGGDACVPQIEKREEILSVTGEPVGKPIRVRVAPMFFDQAVQSIVKPDQLAEIFRIRKLLLFLQPECIPKQSPQFLSEASLPRGFVLLVHFLDLSKQVRETFLLVGRLDFVVGTPKVGN